MNLGSRHEYPEPDECITKAIFSTQWTVPGQGRFGAQSKLYKVMYLPKFVQMASCNTQNILWEACLSTIDAGIEDDL